MATPSPKQKQIIERVMHAFKEHDLEQRDGAPVTNPKQAIAMALHEAGASNRESPEKNRANLARTKRRERQAGSATREAEPTRASLYAEARRRGIPGRSTMSRDDLVRVLGRKT